MFLQRYDLVRTNTNKTCFNLICRAKVSSKKIRFSENKNKRKLAFFVLSSADDKPSLLIIDVTDCGGSTLVAQDVPTRKTNIGFNRTRRKVGGVV